MLYPYIFNSPCKHTFTFTLPKWRKKENIADNIKQLNNPFISVAEFRPLLVELFLFCFKLFKLSGKFNKPLIVACDLRV